MILSTSMQSNSLANKEFSVGISSDFHFCAYNILAAGEKFVHFKFLLVELISSPNSHAGSGQITTDKHNNS